MNGKNAMADRKRTVNCIKTLQLNTLKFNFNVNY